MIETLYVTKVYISDKDKQGNPLKGKFGNYKKVAIKTNEFGDKWLGKSFIMNDRDPHLGIKEGDTIKAKVEKNGEFVNFKLADRYDLLEERISILEAFMKKPNPITSQDEINVESLPF